MKLCDPLKSGDYKLHLLAGGQEEIRTISVCVVGKRDLLYVFITGALCLVVGNRINPQNFNIYNI